MKGNFDRINNLHMDKHNNLKISVNLCILRQIFRITHRIFSFSPQTSTNNHQQATNGN